MKKLFNIFLTVFFLTSITYAQSYIIESFDSNLSQDNTWQFLHEGPPSRIDYSLNTTDKVEGTGSALVKFVIGPHHPWGSYAQLIKTLPADATPWNWTISDSLSIWIKVVTPPTIPANMVFRIHIKDRPTGASNIEEWIYQHNTIIDATTNWVELRIPLKILDSEGNSDPSDQGFVIFPSSWGGSSFWNNKKFDADKIVGFNIAAVTVGWNPSGNIPADSLVVQFDGFRRFGLKAIPAVIFNGMTFPSHISNVWAWGQSTVEVVKGAGPIQNSNAIKWTQGNEWGNGWTGWGMDINPPFNLAGAWPKDTCKIKLKCPPGTGPLRIQFEGGTGKVGKVFQPIADGQWHTYFFPLREMEYQDNTSNFDSSAVHIVGLMAQASGVAGRVIWITDWWTGNPEFDVIPPNPPGGVMAIAGTFQNIVTWQDVPNEIGEKYNIYYSRNPITNINAPGVEVVKLNVPENTQLIEHLLFSPNTNQSVTYYYAVTCVDASGNESDVSVNSQPVTNTARGVATISLNPPNFNPDGDLTEWSHIRPFRMFPSDGSGHIVTNTTINGDNDCSANAYVAVNQSYLYVAFDVNDDIFSPSGNPSSWLNDAPDIYIGLYNWRGLPHTNYQRGAQPDYHIRFTYNRILGDAPSGILDTLGPNYYIGPKFPTGYVVEARIPWTALAALGNDNLFTPVEGFRIPIDFSINDRDNGPEREGILTYSPYNEDQSWRDVSRWLYTWIGNRWDPLSVERQDVMVKDYQLYQNYPNPFNPTTEIQFALPKQDYVTLKVYDVLGKEISTLIEGDLQPGVYKVKFDAGKLSTGVYYYRLTSGSFSQTKKMMIIK
ncbi:MAG: T9SS type A sorting domain-containing protein [Ignavibacteria bacterium]|nr:T9SS type A sorting domain-containing protein [Ignavibacteria bacterium]